MHFGQFWLLLLRLLLLLLCLARPTKQAEARVSCDVLMFSVCICCCLLLLSLLSGLLLLGRQFRKRLCYCIVDCLWDCCCGLSAFVKPSTRRQKGKWIHPEAAAVPDTKIAVDLLFRESAGLLDGIQNAFLLLTRPRTYVNCPCVREGDATRSLSVLTDSS